jgi:hypothetical protein
MRRIERNQPTAETRRILRERLQRFLPANPVSPGRLDGPVRPLVSDVELLKLLSNLEFLSGSDISRARGLYDDIAKTVSPALNTAFASSAIEGQSSTEVVLTAQSNSTEYTTSQVSPEGTSGKETSDVEAGDDVIRNEPTVALRINRTLPGLDGLLSAPSFDQLIELGWIRASWDRFMVPDDIVTAVLRDRRFADLPIGRLIELQSQNLWRLRDGFIPSGLLAQIATEVVANEQGPSQIVCVSPAWIAARLWDATLDNSEHLDAEQRIGDWMDRLSQLQYPQFSISSQLDRSSYEEFVETSISLLSRSSTTPGWEEFRIAAMTPATLLFRTGTVALAPTESIPATSIHRIRWMRGRPQETTYYDYLRTRGSGLMAILVNELRFAPHDPLGLAPRLIELALERPVLFQQFLHAARQTPSLIADLLMSASTCALACTVVVGWEFNAGLWGREFQAYANSSTELFAFEDALAILGGHIDAGHQDVYELTALYQYVYELASTHDMVARRLSMLALLREEIASAGSIIHDRVCSILIDQGRSDRQPIVCLCAALDLISVGDSPERIDPSKAVLLYLEVVIPQGEKDVLPTVDAHLARTLVQLGLRCDAPLRTSFLDAIDVPAWLQLTPSTEAETFVYLDQLRRRIRLHVRILSCAIAGWYSTIPSEIIEALNRSIHAGAIDRYDRGRLDAFAVRIGAGHVPRAREIPISVDLAAALRKLGDVAARSVIAEICQMEEPLVLAGIVSNTPVGINEQIKQRLRNLTPDTSSSIWNLPAMQARVDALLNAGLPDVAEIFLAAERSAQTLGHVPSREASEIRQTLQLLFLREEWAEIASFVIREDMSPHLKLEANDTRLFFQALAEIKNPDGHPAAAEAIFTGLSERHRAVPAYSINLFASRVHRLLAGDVFRILNGDALGEANRYLAEAVLVTRALIQHSPADLKALDANRAMLLLAVNRPAESLQVLLNLRNSYCDEQIEGFRALALARLGSRREALAILTDAEYEYGRTDLLSAVRSNIDAHQPYVAAPHLSIDDDPVPGIRHAFEAFSRLDHVEQAEVLQSRGRLDLYLLEQVRGACASVVALAPMMRDLGMSRYEDDISGVLKQILLSRLLVPQWTVGDSRGGFSSTGGVGERDIVVSKGSATLAVIEAVLTEYVETVNLTSHFTKLFGYDTCRFFFHVTYARRSNCSAIIGYLKSACTMPPAEITYLRTQDLPDYDSMPIGFKATYNIGGRDIVVVFLALEIGQPLQRAAAAAQ